MLQLSIIWSFWIGHILGIPVSWVVSVASPGVVAGGDGTGGRDPVTGAGIGKIGYKCGKLRM